MKHGRHVWVFAVCLAVAVVAGIRLLQSNRASSNVHNRPTQQDTDTAPVPTADTAVPAAASPTPSPTAKPSSALPAPLIPQMPREETDHSQPDQHPVTPPEPAPETPEPDQAPERAVSPAAARFHDTSIPVEKRSAELEQLGKSGSADAVQTLMEVGDMYTYLNFKAVEALGNVKTDEVADYLEKKTTDKDPKVIAQAVTSLAMVRGVDAIPTIAEVVAANRQRPDGYQDTVCAACVKAFGDIGSPAAIPALAAEFENTVGKTLQHEYGSQVVAALRAIGDPAGVPVLNRYAERLQVQKDGMADNPMGQRYLEGKIKEVRDAVTALGAKED